MELNWENAELWVNKNNINIEYGQPKWSFDCGFKLDFDGSLVSISSRFYPPHKNSSGIWEGDVDVFFIENKIASKIFKNKDLDCLKNEVITYLDEIKAKLKDKLKYFTL